MTCEMCAKLLADSKRSAGLFTKAVQRIPGILGDDSRVAAEEVDCLRQACKDARDALMAHFVRSIAISRPKQVLQNVTFRHSRKGLQIA